MFVEFDSLKDTARVWVYQASRPLSPQQEDILSKTLYSFTQQWAAHNQPLLSSFKIFHHQFIVLAADESFNEASGCSIDTATRVFQQIDTDNQLGLFDRTQVAFFVNNEVVVVALSELSKKREQGFWESETLVFNNVIKTKRELLANWIVPAQQTWLKRYLKNVVI
jgi:hypothetical protein